MELKGKAKIQLFNSDSKELIFEATEENIVTNAVERIVTLSGKDFVKGSRGSSTNASYFHLSNVTPVAEELFGGLLLFEGQINEEGDTIFPPVGAIPVGHAGAPYSGSNPYRGTYNETESGTLYSGVNAIGYRHVWDFGTDKANGTISCMCLTSVLGGNTGWKSRGLVASSNNVSVDSDSLLEVGYCPNYSLPFKSFSTPTVRRDGQLIASAFSNNEVGRLIYVNEATGDLFFALAYSSTRPGMIVKAKHPLIKNLSIFEDVQGHVAPQFETYITTNRTQFDYMGYFEFDPSSGNFKIVFITNSTTLVEEVYGPTGLISTKTISIAGSGSEFYMYKTIPPFIYKGNYYAQTTNQNIIKVSPSGEILATYDVSAIASQSFSVHYSRILDRIILKRTYTASYPGVAVLFDGSTFEAFRTGEQESSAILPSDCSNPVAPGTYTCAVYPYAGYAKSIAYAFYTNYLATINNLAEPVVKTSSTTMKVTYDIYTT